MFTISAVPGVCGEVFFLGAQARVVVQVRVRRRAWGLRPRRRRARAERAARASRRTAHASGAVRLASSIATLHVQLQHTRPFNDSLRRTEC